MSKLGKIFLGVSGFSFLGLVISRHLIGEWQNMLWVPLLLSMIFFFAGIAKDLIFFKELFTLRTTKHGLNFGAMVLLVTIILIAINFIAVEKNIKFDMTEDKLNSLSDQSVSIVGGLTEELVIRGFYKKGAEEEEQEKAQLEALIKLYQDESTKIRLSMVDPIRSPDVAKEFGVEASGEVVITYKGKKNSLSNPSEESLTNAIIKLTREKNKVIYALKGHGERDVEDSGPTGASRFKEALSGSSYEIRSLSLIEKREIPADGDTILIFGGSQALLGPELASLRTFAFNGGKFLIAVDPGSRSNLGELTKALGVEFRNNYIVDQFGQMVGASAAMAIGLEYSKNSDITKKFTNTMTAFQLASALKKVDGAVDEQKYDEIVKSSPASFAKRELTRQVRMESGDEKGPLPIAVTTEGKIKIKEKPSDKVFSAVVFGDSDFLTNQMLDIQLNRDLAMNSVAYLAKDTELISIRPKQARGTTLNMTETQAKLTIWGIFAPLPILLFGIGAVLWFRRRNA